MAPAQAAQSGTLHRYSKRLVAFEYASSSPGSSIILWIGGLGDGLGTVSYPSFLAKALPSGWSLAQVELLSSLNGWGMGSLQRDVKEIAEAVTYFRNLGKKTVVLMGHSTGCQDCMEYVSGKGREERPKVDGVALQAPVSDREAFGEHIDAETMKKIISTAREYVADGRADDALPQSLKALFPGPVSAYRWLSLLSPDKDGDDDYFSSDLPDSKLDSSFGAFWEGGPALCILYGEKDEYVPAEIDVLGLIERWKAAVKRAAGKTSKASGLVKGAHHNLEVDDEEVVKGLIGQVLEFLGEIDGHGGGGGVESKLAQVAL